MIFIHNYDTDCQYDNTDIFRESVDGRGAGEDEGDIEPSPSYYVKPQSLDL